MPEQPGTIGTSSRPINLVAAALVLTQTVDELPGNIAKASIGENGDIQFLSEFDDFSNDELITQLSGDQETLIGGHAVVSGSQKDLTRWHLGNGFLVGIQSTNEPVAAGDDLTVDAQIKNVSGSSATKDVALDVANAERDRKSVSLNKGASTTVSLTWSTQSGDGGNYTATVSSPDDTDSQSVTVGGTVIYADSSDANDWAKVSESAGTISFNDDGIEMVINTTDAFTGCTVEYSGPPSGDISVDYSGDITGDLGPVPIGNDSLTLVSTFKTDKFQVALNADNNEVDNYSENFTGTVLWEAPIVVDTT